MLKAASVARAEGICIPVLLGNEERISKIIAENNIDLKDVEIVNMRHDQGGSLQTKICTLCNTKTSAGRYDI
jgi:phosphotransacetylase